MSDGPTYPKAKALSDGKFWCAGLGIMQGAGKENSGLSQLGFSASHSERVLGSGLD